MSKNRKNVERAGNPDTVAKGPVEAIWNWVLKLPRPLNFAATALAGLGLLLYAAWSAFGAAGQAFVLERFFGSTKQPVEPVHYTGLVNATKHGERLPPFRANLSITIDRSNVSGLYSNATGDEGLVKGTVVDGRLALKSIAYCRPGETCAMMPAIGAGQF